MREFLAQHSYLVIWVVALIIIGAAAVAIVQLNSFVPGLHLHGSSSAGNSVAQPSQPAVPAAPSVSFTIEKSKTGNSFVVQWENLPSGTIALNVFRGQTGTDPSTWSLWKNLTLSPGELNEGSESINLGSDTEAGYAFYLQAVSGDNGSGNGANASETNDQIVLWTSSSTIPVVTTSTPSGSPPPSQTNNPDQSNNNNNSSTSSSTNPSASSTNPGAGNTPSSTSLTPSSTPTSTSDYYNPQVQPLGNGPGQGNFWVQYVNQSIEIGWQGIPSNADTITVARSSDSSGPWSTILIQNNPGTSGSYSFNLVDSSVGQSNYYELTALEGTTTLATYGPTYLAGN